MYKMKFVIAVVLIVNCFNIFCSEITFQEINRQKQLQYYAGNYRYLSDKEKATFHLMLCGIKDLIYAREILSVNLSYMYLRDILRNILILVHGFDFNAFNNKKEKDQFIFDSAVANGLILNSDYWKICSDLYVKENWSSLNQNNFIIELDKVIERLKEVPL
jgi:hypothetical protein